MSSSRILPPAPSVTLDLVDDLTPEQPQGFVQLVRQRLMAHAPAGPSTKPFVYDWVERRSLDAVVVVVYFFDPEGHCRVYLRSATRPPVVLRGAQRIPRSSIWGTEGLWELAAGLVEPEEETLDGTQACACREVEEELGFSVPKERMRELGPSTLPCPGVVGERHYYFAAEVDPKERREPSLDGSALEQHGAIIDVPLVDALLACRNGELEDAKTELGLRRLADELRQGE